MSFIIRQETKTDYAETEQVVKSAFETAEMTDHQEHHLVARLRQSDAFIPELSLVAINKETEAIIGHVLLTKIQIKSETATYPSLALAPVSVLPAYQKAGVGKALIEEVIRIAKKAGYLSIIVLGHPTYYPKFGFEKSANWHIKAPFDVPEDALMALELQVDGLKDVTGIIEYPKVFFE